MSKEVRIVSVTAKTLSKAMLFSKSLLLCSLLQNPATSFLSAHAQAPYGRLDRPAHDQIAINPGFHRHSAAAIDTSHMHGIRAQTPLSRRRRRTSIRTLVPNGSHADPGNGCAMAGLTLTRASTSGTHGSVCR